MAYGYEFVSHGFHTRNEMDMRVLEPSRSRSLQQPHFTIVFGGAANAVRNIWAWSCVISPGCSHKR